MMPPPLSSTAASQCTTALQGGVLESAILSLVSFFTCFLSASVSVSVSVFLSLPLCLSLCLCASVVCGGLWSRGQVSPQSPKRERKAQSPMASPDMDSRHPPLEIQTRYPTNNKCLNRVLPGGLGSFILL